MALKDILQAITNEAQTRITQASVQHQQALATLRDEHARAMERDLGQIRQRRDQQKHQLRSHAEAQATMLLRHTLLRRKQEHIDAVYEDVIRQFQQLPKEKAAAFIAACMALVEGPGVVHPAAAHAAVVKDCLPKGCVIGETIDARGGFRFVGATRDLDCTIDALVRVILRPATEIVTAQHLFDV